MYIVCTYLHKYVHMYIHFKNYFFNQPNVDESGMVPIKGMSFGKQVSINHWLETRMAKKEI
jgi:hypothetical protein